MSKSETLHLDTGGRGKLQCDLHFAWDNQNLSVLVQQTAKSEKVHEITDAAAYRYAPWNSDGVWLHIDLANGRLPSVGDLVLAMSLNSKGQRDLFEASMPWDVLIRCATSGRAQLAQRLGKIAPGFRLGCEPMLIEFNHARQSFIGGAQYIRATGRDANSRDIVLRAAPDCRPSINKFSYITVGRHRRRNCYRPAGLLRSASTCLKSSR